LIRRLRTEIETSRCFGENEYLTRGFRCGKIYGNLQKTGQSATEI
jgi:hypothetical protein